MSTAYKESWERREAAWLEECTDTVQISLKQHAYRQMKAKSRFKNTQQYFASLIEIADMRIREIAEQTGRSENPCTEI